MRYVSTRSAEVPGLPFCDILLEGLAPDGGLYLPESYPQVSAETLAHWDALLHDQGYAAVAFEVLSLFVDDIPEATFVTPGLTTIRHDLYQLGAMACDRLLALFREEITKCRDLLPVKLVERESTGPVQTAAKPG